MSTDRGRPTKYDPKYCEEIIEYFSVKPYEIIEKKITNKKGETHTVLEKEAADFPSLAGFCCKIGIHRDTLHKWTKKHKDFFDAVHKAKEHQENYLVVNGLKNLIQPTFAQFVAKNYTSLRDRQPDEVENIHVTSEVKSKYTETIKSLISAKRNREDS